MAGTFFNYRLVGLKRLQKAVQEAPGLLATENAIALRSSVDLVKTIASANEPTGPGHFGFHLRDSFYTRVTVGLRRSTGIVATNAVQGRFRDLGTKAHDIAPRSGKALAFDGIVVGLVHHPGEKPRHTLRKALATAKPSIRSFFVAATLRVTASMAGSGD